MIYKVTGFQEGFTKVFEDHIPATCAVAFCGIDSTKVWKIAAHLDPDCGIESGPAGVIAGTGPTTGCVRFSEVQPGTESAGYFDYGNQYNLYVYTDLDCTMGEQSTAGGCINVIDHQFYQVR